MKPALFAGVLASLSIAFAEDASQRLYTIPSWGDFAVVYANGTDPAMDSPQGMENMFAFWKARGFAGVFLRTDLQQYDPFVKRHARAQMNPSLALMWRHIDDLAGSFDYFAAAQRAAGRTGLEFWAYHPHIYSDGAPEDAGVEGPGRMVPWSYVSKAMVDHPEIVTVDRRGNKYWMVPEYAYEVARTQKVAEFVHMARKYGIKHFIANMRSEVSQLQDPADKADRFGFNQRVVDEMQRLHGVNILTDPRFDVDSPDFDPHDDMLSKWRDLRGTYLTQLWRELRAALRAVDPEITLAITLAGEHIGPPLGNWRTDWRTWVDEGLMDYLISPVFFEATLDHDADMKGYLTHSRAGVGTVTHQALKAYIKRSRHPEIRVIATGGPSYLFTSSPVPDAADGMQCDAWYGAYHRAWHQRWRQWQADLLEQGHIKFIEQNFDNVSPRDFALPSGGWGGMAYDPKLRACPGAWWRLGDGAGSKPFAQSQVRRGDTGQTIQLTRAGDGRGTLTGWHNASPDRSKYAMCVDTSMTSGLATFDFWVLRKGADSALSAYLQGDMSEFEVGLRVAPGDGMISYSTGTLRGAGNWVETTHALPDGGWHKLSIEVDIDSRHYGARIGGTKLCEKIAIRPPKERFVELPGVNLPIAVPVFKEFKSVLFVPEGPTGSVSFIDDVSVRWQPAAIFDPPGAHIEFTEDFEPYPHGTAIESSLVKPKWRSSAASNGTVIPGTSFGEGVKSLRLGGGNTLAAQTPRPTTAGSRLTLDLDLFVRSGEGLPSIMPRAATKFPHSARIGWADPAGEPIACIIAQDGTWRLWGNDRWIDTKHPVHYDMWNHLQLTLEDSGTCRAAVQPVGQVPALIGTARIGERRHASPLAVTIRTSATDGHLSCYDNLVVTSGEPVKK